MCSYLSANILPLTLTDNDAGPTTTTSPPTTTTPPANATAPQPQKVVPLDGVFNSVSGEDFTLECVDDYE